MNQSATRSTWRDRTLEAAAIFFGLAGPLFFFGPAVLGIGLGLALVLGIIGGHPGDAWQRMRQDIATPLGLLIVLIFVLWVPSVVGSVHIAKSVPTWFGRFGIVAGAWFVMRLVEPKGRCAWNALIWGSWLLIAYCVLAALTTPDILSIKALLTQSEHVNITRRLKPVGSFLMFALVLLGADALDNKGLRRVVSVLAILAVPYIIYVSDARANAGGVLAILGTITIAAIISARSKLVPLLLLCGLVALVVAVGFWVRSVEIHWSAEGNFQPYLPLGLVDLHRQVIWHYVFGHVFDHPLIGWGVNSTPYMPGADQVVGTAKLPVLPAHPHNWFMEIWVETGFLGMIPTVALVVLGGISGLGWIRQYGAKLAAPIVAVFAAFWFSGLFNYSFWNSWWFSVFWMSLLLLTLRFDAGVRARDKTGRGKLLFVCTEDWYFLSHRIGLARAALVQGYEVVVACRANQAAETLRAEGLRVIDLPMARGGLNPLRVLATMAKLACLIRREKPDVVINIALQCVILSAFAGLIVGARRSVNLITGLGFVFVSDGIKAKVARTVISSLFRFYALCPSMTLIVQNADDQALMSKFGFKSPRLAVIRGSGVDVSAFAPTDGASSKGTQPKTAIFVARMLWSKGLAELIEAVKLIRARGWDYK
jgi:O-antigen ligase